MSGYYLSVILHVRGKSVSPFFVVRFPFLGSLLLLGWLLGMELRENEVAYSSAYIS